MKRVPRNAVSAHRVFIISLTGYYLNTRTPNIEGAIESLDGNICRCTGYESIKRAIVSVNEKISNSTGIKNHFEKLIFQKIIPKYLINIPLKLTSMQENISKTEWKNDSPIQNISGGTDLLVQKWEELIEADVSLIFSRNGRDKISIENNNIVVAANTTISEFQNSEIIKQYYPELKKHLNLFGSLPIRNRATIGGNIVNASPIGDMTNILLALHAELTISDGNSNRLVKLNQFYNGYKEFDLNTSELIDTITIPIPNSGTLFNFEKVSRRTYLDIASVNTTILLEMENDVIKRAGFSAGGVFPYPLFLSNTVIFLENKQISTEVLLEVINISVTEISPISDARGTSEYKSLLLRQLLIAHFIKFLSGTYCCGGISMNNYDTSQHVQGKSIFIDDQNCPTGTLSAAVYTSPIANGKIVRIDIEEALANNGVKGILTFNDIPGENQVGGIIKDEPLLAEDKVHYVGQPIAIIAADTQLAANEAARKIKGEFEELESILNPKEACEKGELHCSSYGI